MTGNIVIGVPSSMKLYSISETKLQVVSTLLRIHVACSMIEVRQVRSWNSQSTVIFAALSESTRENLILSRNTTCAISQQS
jgi:Tfp pilus assembly major pilin PilA